MDKLFYGSNTAVKISSQDNTVTNAAIDPKSNTSISDSSLMDNSRESIAKASYSNENSSNIDFLKLFKEYALYIWLIGVVIVITYNLFGYFRFSIYLKRSNKPANDEEKRLLNELLDGRYKAELVRNPSVSTPMLIGIRKPNIVIPDMDFEKEQLKNILLHEVSHLKRFDIGVKWLTMIAVSIHWFNPLIYVLKKEINHACELACDEAVIKNLNSCEKQAYGDTLISLAAEHKFPAGVMQATLCEEKKSLKERLVSIMNHGRKSRLAIVISAVLLVIAATGAVVLGASVGNKSEKLPEVYIGADGIWKKATLIGNYNDKDIKPDAKNALSFKYESDNIVSINVNHKLLIDIQKFKSDKKHDFVDGQISVYSVYKEGKEVETRTISSLNNEKISIQAPQESGEYIYSLRLNSKDEGTYDYGFVVRVDMFTYDLAEISKYRTPYIGNNSKVLGVVGNLPVPDSYFVQHYISLQTDKQPYGLTVYYEARDGGVHNVEWPVTKHDNVIFSRMQKNALVLYCMIDNLDSVTFAFRDSKSEGELDTSKYRTSFNFSRASIENEFGDISTLSKDMNKLKQVLEGKTKELKTAIQTSSTIMPGYSVAEVDANVKLSKNIYEMLQQKITRLWQIDDQE